MSLNASDLERCFQYHLRSSTVVKLSSTGKLLTWLLSSEKDWQKWLDDASAPTSPYHCSLADVSAFSANNVCMQSAEGDSYRSYVYNARTSNEWEGDLAMTATYFPCRQLTFGILLGCTETIEDKVIKRLRLVGSDATHPLIPFGIMAEIERSRHIKLVEDSIDGLETNIDQLSERIETRGETSQEEVDRRSRDRKENQLKHMTRHARLLQSAPTINTPQTATTKENGHGLQDTQHNGNLEHRTLEASSTRISDRLEAIVEEYDEKIRDSAMRLDGMAMATQWSYSDTNVEIALATTRDSKHMRSISLITMIFLPGTFLATIFSMTFFDWGDGTGKARVSGMIWIYFALAFGFTVVTLGSWYFWTSRRRRTENICHY
ncbi:hypothetical protein HYQ45_008480 [Verticillium longisporum]|uniref:Uncharacterized protein n=1 Tax=Verticillium longisporum TaxID=100787 RepID=A0A8I2ZMJ4_VERLO|nr:hypothetical protein HYQ45_008480 [Verticillium longisporum]